MLIPFKELIQRHNLKPTGIIHIGASHGEEAAQYLAEGLNRQIWIEAIPEVFLKLKEALQSNPSAYPVNACISDVPGKYVQFHVTNNAGQSSSMLGLGLHRKYHPDVHVEKTITLVTDTVDSIIERTGIDLTYYDFLNIDLQGAELLALKGMIKNLHKIKAAYIEVNKEELYTGCALVEEIDQFMNQFGFTRVETKWTDCSWGDALYLKTA